MTIEVPLSRSRFHSSTVLPLFILITFLIQGLLLLMVFFQGSQLNQLTNQAAKTMLQMVDGQVVQVSAASACVRSPAVTQNFANQWTLFNYTWNNRVPPIAGAKSRLEDPGVRIGNSRIPTTTATAAFLITDENNFRKKYLEQVSDIVPQGVFQGYQETVVRYSRPLAPKQIEPCKWEVNVYAYMDVLENGAAAGDPIGINQKLTLIAVPPAIHPLPSGLSPLQETVYRLGIPGLLIENIEFLPD